MANKGLTLAAAASLTLMVGCANLTPGQKGAGVGAAAGGVVGSILTGGSTLGTVGGAAAGAIIGNEVARKR
ncbi:MAG: glycine zipper 2TM domain-containing protein [Burkholderiales bacterium]|nr:glycine zipper 2TM domain-containing protein [Burkholderiales bacterium]